MFHVLKMERTWTPADLSKFPDGANVSSWAKEAMQDAVALGLINGTKASDGVVYLDPQGQRRPPAGRNDPDELLPEREEVITVAQDGITACQKAPPRALPEGVLCV